MTRAATAHAVLLTVLVACASDGGDTGASSAEAGSGAEMSETGDAQLPSNCGWGGSAYVCSVTGADPGGTPIACPMPMEIGPCSFQDEPQSCCDVDGNAWQCVCDGQACDYAWRENDCAHAAGAGACGWWAEYGYYSCGGEGSDPEGTPMGCAADLVAGAPCVPGQDIPCCDPDGDQWQCYTDEFGESSTWIVIDC